MPGQVQIRAGDKIEVTQWPVSVSVTENTDQTDISSTSYTAGTPECGVGFVAPDSGVVGIALAAEMREQAAGNRVFVSPQVFLGTSSSGTEILVPNVNRGVSTSGDATASQFMTHGNFSVLMGLTPGADYFIRTMHLTEGGTTNDIGHRRLVVIPLP